jgi:hypothetical protein
MQTNCPVSCNLCTSAIITTSQLPSSSVSSTNIACKDSPNFMALCQSVVSVGQCTNSQFFSLTQMFCPVSCNLCSSFTGITIAPQNPSICADVAQFASICQLASSFGYCSNSAYITLAQGYCPLTCKFCTQASTQQGAVTTVTSTSVVCKDSPSFASICQLAVTAGQCSSSQFISLTQIYCPVSCNLCSTFTGVTLPTPNPSVCADSSAYASICQLVSSLGYCQNPQYISLTQVYCSVSCKFCTPVG